MHVKCNNICENMFIYEKVLNFPENHSWIQFKIIKIFVSKYFRSILIENNKYINKQT